jgi:hypothetical protein
MMLADSASVAGSPDRANEDYVVVQSGSVSVVDGQTARTETGCVHGVAWYAQSLAETMAAQLEDGRMPAEGLSVAIRRTTGRHESTCDLAAPGTPSATVAAVQTTGGWLQWLVLGDLTLIVETVGGVRVLSDPRVRETALVERRIADQMSANDPRKPEALVRMKHAELAARNVPGGFWAAATDPGAADQAIIGSLPLDQVGRVAILTDGAARSVDLFGRHTWAEALDAIERLTPAGFIAEVRAIEETDPDCTRWPRNKASDDATVAFCTHLPPGGPFPNADVASRRN